MTPAPDDPLSRRAVKYLRILAATTIGLAATTGWLALKADGHGRIDDPIGAAPAAIPADGGWKRFDDPTQGVRLTLPKDWFVRAGGGGSHLGNPIHTLEVVSHPYPEDGYCAHAPMGALKQIDEREDIVIITLFERLPDDMDADPARSSSPKPARFGPDFGSNGDSSPACFNGDPPPFSHWFGDFSLNGRMFHALVVFGPRTPPSVQAAAWQVLDSFDASERPRASGDEPEATSAGAGAWTQRPLSNGLFTSEFGLRFRVPRSWKAWDVANSYGGDYVHLGPRKTQTLLLVLISERQESYRHTCKPEPQTGDVEPYVCRWATINGVRWHEQRKVSEGRNHVAILTTIRAQTFYRLILQLGNTDAPLPNTVVDTLRSHD